jgi:thiamine biosynthesis lipoprotein
MADATSVTRTRQSPRPASDDWTLWSTTARLVVTEPATLAEARALVDTVLTDVDSAANRFRPDSEIENLPTDGRTAQVSPMLARLVERSLEAARLSGGRVDPTVGNALRHIGYDRDIHLVVSDGAPVRAVVRQLPRWRAVRVERCSLTVPAGVRLDLGATAKAVAADLSARAVATALPTGVLVSLGGDVATQGRSPAGGWQVLVQDGDDDAGTQVTLAPGTAVATSSTRHRAWLQGSEAVHHIVDPRTGRSAHSPWRTVSVVGASCFEANTASTAAIVAGERAVRWLEGTNLPARLVDEAGRVVTLGGWPDDEGAA